MKRRGLIIITTLLLCLSVACQRRGAGPGLHKVDVDQLELYTQNKSLWESQQLPQGYEFEFRQVCFCAFNYSTIKLKISEAGDILSTSYFTNQGQVVDSPSPEKQESVDSLFARIQEALDDNLSQVEVTYNEQFGYPVLIYLDADSRTIDDEISIEVLSFTAL